MLMPMARMPKAIWLPLDAIDQDMFNKANERGPCVQSTSPSLIGIGMPKFKQQSSHVAVLTKYQNYVNLQTVGIQVRLKFHCNNNSLDEVTRKKA